MELQVSDGIFLSHDNEQNLAIDLNQHFEAKKPQIPLKILDKY